MSWLAKVSHIAGRAEDFLNKIDQNAAEALKKSKVSNSIKLLVDNDNDNNEDFVCNKCPENLPKFSNNINLNHIVPINGRPNKAHIENYNTNFEQVQTCNQYSSVIKDLLIRNPTALENIEQSDVITSSCDTENERINLLKYVQLKENQIAVMCVRLQEAEEALIQKDIKAAELMRDMEQKIELKSRNPDNELSTLIGLEQSYKAEIDQYNKREKELCKRLQISSEEKTALYNELHGLKSIVSELEMYKKQSDDEILLMKHNLEVQKNEFDEYKQKAQKVLNAKEKLLESLKENVDDFDQNTLSVQLKAVSSECELLKEDLQQSNLTILNLKTYVQELEQCLKEQKKLSGSHVEQLLEEISRSTALVNQFREEKERIQLEYDFLHNELQRQEKAVEKKLIEKDAELLKLMEEKKQRKRYEKGEIEEKIAMMGEKIIAKQTEIERLESEKRALEFRLERSEKALQQAEFAAIKNYAVEMRENSTINRNISFLEGTPSNHILVEICKAIFRTFDRAGFVFK